MMCSESATQRVRDAGLRLTPQRRAVIEALCGDTTHPAAEDVARKVETIVPGVSLSTVYKTLHEFAEVGLVQRVDGPGVMRFDPDPVPHGHLVCDRCGTVTDLPLTEDVVDALIAGAPRPEQVSRVEVTLHAQCSACMTESTS